MSQGDSGVEQETMSRTDETVRVDTDEREEQGATSLEDNTLNEPEPEIEIMTKAQVDELVNNLNIFGLNIMFRKLQINNMGSADELIDRLYRHELIRVLGPEAAPWDPFTDGRIDFYPDDIKLTRGEMNLRNFIAEAIDPSSTLYRHIQGDFRIRDNTWNPEDSDFSLSLNDTRSRTINKGTIPKRRTPSVVTDQNALTPSINIVQCDSLQERQNSQHETNRDRRVTFTEPVRNASSPIPTNTSGIHALSQRGANSREFTNETSNLTNRGVTERTVALCGRAQPELYESDLLDHYEGGESPAQTHRRFSPFEGNYMSAASDRVIRA
ncbi:hypothetical protein PV325_013557, partial [Microctonus aethiopoides]